MYYKCTCVFTLVLIINFHFAVLLNSPSIFDKIFSDEFILDIIGALECMLSSLFPHVSHIPSLQHAIM
jgi:hypothetical protein